MKQIKNKTGLRLTINKNWDTIAYARDAWKLLVQDSLVDTIIKQAFRANSYKTSQIRLSTRLNQIVASMNVVSTMKQLPTFKKKVVKPFTSKIAPTIIIKPSRSEVKQNIKVK
uniref:Uncharacterized protein n=1 Tax=Capsaspora owczarzaki TaxID=192875 RepID=M1K395_9EUKA|nr:hypothetical protein [Capsaspora owczarzaki]